MSRLVARLLLSLLMMPVAALVYLLTCAAVANTNRYYSRYDEQYMFAIAGVVTFVMIIAYWLCLWGWIVQWTGTRRLVTGASVPVAAVAGLLVYGVLGALTDRFGDRSFAAFIGSVTAPLLWLVATVLVWRETAGERARRLRGATRGGIACPTCGYNLTGLTTTRCPECGTQFTLDELLAQQAGKEVGELEEG